VWDPHQCGHSPRVSYPLNFTPRRRNANITFWKNSRWLKLSYRKCFYCCIVYLTMIIRSDYSDDGWNDYCILNWQGCIKKRLWQNLRYHTRIFLEWGGKSRTSVTTVDLWTDISIRDLINIGEKCYGLHRGTRILTVATIRNIHCKSPYTVYRVRWFTVINIWTL
jgi:hypothetical protein